MLIPVHIVARVNHKAIRDGGFHRYLNKVQRINSSDRGRLCQWLQGVFIELYAFNAGPLDEMNIARSVVAIDREFSFTIDLLPGFRRTKQLLG